MSSVSFKKTPFRGIWKNGSIAMEMIADCPANIIKRISC